MLVCGMFVEFQCQPMAIYWLGLANVQGLADMQGRALVVTIHIAMATSMSSTPARTTQKPRIGKKVAYCATQKHSPITCSYVCGGKHKQLE